MQITYKAIVRLYVDDLEEFLDKEKAVEILGDVLDRPDAHEFVEITYESEDS